MRASRLSRLYTEGGTNRVGGGGGGREARENPEENIPRRDWRWKKKKFREIE